MLILRLSRVGKKKQPTYRLVVQEKHRDPWGTSVEILGNYNPRTKALDIKEDRIKHWLNNGAQMSPTVNNLLIDKKVISGEKVRATTNDVKKEDVSAPEEKGAEKKKEEKPAEAPAEEEKPKEEPVVKEQKEEAPKEEAVPEKPSSEPEATEDKPEEKKAA